VATVFTVTAAGQPDFDLTGYPVGALHAVARDGLLGRRLLTTDVDAGYVILEDWPRQRVFIDDRYDMYPRPIIADYFTLARSQPGWDAVLQREDIQAIVWPRRDPLVTLVEDTGHWRVRYQDRDRVLLVRDDVR